MTVILLMQIRSLAIALFLKLLSILATHLLDFSPTVGLKSGLQNATEVALGAMWLYPSVRCLLGVFVCLRTISSERQSGLARSYSELWNLLPQSGMEVQADRVDSTPRCLSMCLSQLGCVLFFYNAPKKTCQLHRYNLLPPDPPHTLAERGVKAYFLYAESCPAAKGYVFENNLNICYKVFTVQSSWMNAANTCAMDKGHLMVIDTAEKFSYIKNVLKQAVQYNSSWYHFGASDTIRHGKWVWWNGKPMGNWLQGSPDNYDGNQHCLALDHRKDFLWNDVSCQINIFRFLCEIDVL